MARGFLGAVKQPRRDGSWRGRGFLGVVKQPGTGLRGRGFLGVVQQPETDGS